MFSMIPLLALSLIIYAVANVLDGETLWTTQELFTLAMPAGNDWLVTFGDAFIIFSMLLLFIELLRATSTGTDSIVNHFLSAILMVANVLLFVMVSSFGNSVFFIYMAMTFLDFMAGFIITTKASRRDFGVAA
ncbi:hypothetical protein [Parvularcula marina]|uniref:Uncharacterized protein n=1 Tax=Parvularcula marina TaxID=2292771 RepID=A0A371RH40_9PROT|nr:hypothetical protein [Parvularcula marina]RFB04771.1 hypothetical protein DX908_05435 [Parvularcula marina]